VEPVIEFFHHLVDPKAFVTYISSHGSIIGLAIILLVVFVENGIFFGFFLPGDTLLLTTGIFCSTDKLHIPLSHLLIAIPLAAIIGSIAGYAFGKKMGENLYKRKDSLLFKKKYLFTAEAFFKKYGGLALIMGRFLPIIRTFAPIFAGAVNLDYKKFLTYNITGAILWVFSMVLLGYFLGNIPGVSENLEYVILGIIVITWIPVVRTYYKERKNMKNTPKADNITN
jgi:membrane-associated protein